MLFIFTIWEARNKAIFKNIWTPINISSALLVQKVQEHRTAPKIGKHRKIIALVINKSTAWPFFDGASQGDLAIGGAGGVICITDSKKITYKLGMGRATKTRAELMAHWATLKIEKYKQIANLNIYGDSKTVIEWAQERNTIQAPHLQNFLRIIQSMLPCFAALNFNHVYREFNSEADILSKQALAIQPGIIQGEIFDEGDSIMFHIPL